MPRDGKVPGGHVIQITKTADYVARQGLESEISFDANLPSGTYDIVHGFGLKSSDVRLAKLRGSKVVQSTIYWDKSYDCYSDIRNPQYTLQYGVRRMRRLLGKMKRTLLKQSMITQNELELRNTLLELDAILPNSELESDAIKRDLGVTVPSYVVPNAVDVDVFHNKHNQRIPSVLCCGRIEPHKNQLGLIIALENTDIPLTIAGMPHPDHPKYVEQVKSKCVGNIQYVGGFEQSGLVDLYNRHSVHIIPSWFETTGLVTLEASLCGCKVVSTVRGYAYEYFGSMAEYCEPSSIRSIKESVVRSLNKQPDQSLEEKVKAMYSWDATARATIACYRDLC
jgi:glycosyltransferase involved in cell wall biosynthesis